MASDCELESLSFCVSEISSRATSQRESQVRAKKKNTLCSRGVRDASVECNYSLSEAGLPGSRSRYRNPWYETAR